MAVSLANLGLVTAVHAQSSVTLAWDPSPDPGVIGYKVYDGLASRTYTFTNNVGNATNTTLTMLLPGTTYYFAVTAYDTNFLESPFSGELSYTVPSVVTNVARLILSMNSSRQVTLAGVAPASSTYAVLATRDFKTWTTNGTVTVGAGGGFQFIDPGSVTNSKCFYRLRKLSALTPVVTNIASLMLSVNSSKQVTLTGSAPVSDTYVILATRDFKTWTTNGTVTVGADGRFQSTDPNLATNSRAFYRLRRV